MSFLDSKTARVAATLLAFALGLGLLWTLRQLLFLLILGLFLAYTIEPLIGYIRRIAPRAISRNLAITAVYLTVLALAGAGIAWLGKEISSQAVSLAARLPEIAKDPAKFTGIALPAALEPFRDDVLAYGVEFVQTALTRMLHGLGSALLFILVPIFAFFFLKDGPQMKNALLDFFEQFSERQRTASLFTQFHELLSQYIRALLFLSIAVFVAYALFYEVMGVPYALLLATLAAVLEIVPVAGWISAAVVSLLISAYSGYPHWGWMIVFYIVFRLFQDYVVVPFLMGEGIELHPVAVLAAVIAGELVGGVPGMFLSIPALAAGRILWRHFSVTQS